MAKKLLLIVVSYPQIWVKFKKQSYLCKDRGRQFYDRKTMITVPYLHIQIKIPNFAKIYNCLHQAFDNVAKNVIP